MAWQPKPAQWFVIGVWFLQGKPRRPKPTEASQPPPTEPDPISPEARHACDILDVSPDASLEEIRQAYKDFVQVWHPDRFGHDSELRAKAESKLKEINGAWAYLEERLGSTAAPQPAESESTPESDEQSPAHQPTPAGTGYGMALAITVAAVMFLVVGFWPVIVEDFRLGVEGFRRGYEEGRRGGAERSVAAPVGARPVSSSTSRIAEPVSRTYRYSLADGAELTLTTDDGTLPPDDVVAEILERVRPGQSANFSVNVPDGQTYAVEASRTQALPPAARQQVRRPTESTVPRLRPAQPVPLSPSSRVQLPGTSIVEVTRPPARLTKPERLTSHYRIKIDAAHPDYPRQALQEQVQGAVSLDVTVGPDGTVSNIEVLGSIPMLEQAAINIVRTSNFEESSQFLVETLHGS